MDKVDSIVVRMYNTGSVGDCLLLQFQKKKQTTFTMLIDCGGYHTNTQPITDCVNEIKQTTGSKIDLLVVTHEHLDHVSGFNQAQAVFKTMNFNQVWMAWTENDKDKLAQQLKTDLGKKVKKIVDKMTGENKKLDPKSKDKSLPKSAGKRLNYHAESWSAILEALHFESGKGLNASLKVSDAMTFVKSKSKEKAKMFKMPGDVIRDMEGAEGIKFHILGPPYDEKLSGIRKTLQTDEVYSLAKHAAFAASQSFLDAVTHSDAEGTASVSPFKPKYYMKNEEKSRFFKSYNSSDMAWRQIEEDWLSVSEQLAIAVNTYTNNTSLAMAIEFEDSGKVLLFPGDAQSGNWMSWHNETVTDSLKKNGGKSADDLLSKTVFYKVGHHGSHNGTASKSGLDKMTNPDLVAIMTLVHDKIPTAWVPAGFPAKALYTKLIEKTNGAIIRLDEGLIKDSRAKVLREKNLSAAVLEKLNNAAMPFGYKWEVEA